MKGYRTAMATEPHRRQPTLDEVAERAGVSRTAASRVINNAPHVSRAKRDAVERAIKDLGYTPSRTAQALATRRTGVVALAIAENDPALFADPFFGQVIVGVSSALENTELHLMLCVAASDRGQARLRNLLRTRGADGVMLIALRGKDPLVRIAQNAGLPIVFGGRPLHHEPSWYVDADNRGGARTATEYLIGAGRTRVAAITGLPNTEVADARHRGYVEAMTMAGLAPYAERPGDFTEPSGAAAMAALLDTHPDLDAVFAANDNMAAGALRVLRNSGRSVPGDVAVIGFDDLPIATHTDPPLTTIHQPIQSLGREMARMLLDLLDGQQPSPLILPTRLVVRESA
jgi:DNA-binding LacI/PurR family transcriptional regulator